MTKKILRIDSSMRKADSYSRKLTDNLVEQISQQELCNIVVRDLSHGVPLINEAWINANFTDEKERTKEQKAVLFDSDTLVSELQNADVIVIGLPIYNFGVPGAFKSWIDQIARANLTFRYSEKGPTGLLVNKKAYVIVVSGGTQLNSKLDFITDYVRHVLGFVGIKDVVIIDSSGLALNEDKAWSNAKEEIEMI